MQKKTVSQGFQVPGFTASGVSCGIKTNKQKDLALIFSEKPAVAAGVFRHAPMQATTTAVSSCLPRSLAAPVKPRRTFSGPFLVSIRGRTLCLRVHSIPFAE